MVDDSWLGAELAGYCIDALVGRGSAGVVYRATHLRLQRPAAVKLLAAGLAVDVEYRRQVYLSVGPHDRPPRRYRERDFCWWLGVLNKWEMAAPPRGAEHVTIAVSGAHGGRTVDFRELAADGITLLGMTRSFEDGTLRFAPDLRDNIANGDANYLSMLDEADDYVARNGLDLPEEPQARTFGPDPESLRDPILELELASAGITSIVWATGFVSDYSWLPPGALDERGKPKHQRGVSAEPGIYFLGLPWQSRRGSSFIWGVWHDAAYVAEHITIQRGYLAYGNVDASVDPRRLTAAPSDLDLGEKPVVTATGAA